MAPTQSSDIQKFRIVTAGTHFLYLPLYFAKSKDFFNLLPPNYQLEVDSHASRTDANTFQMLMNRSFEAYKDVAFAVCDPVVLLSDPVNTTQSYHPIVSAALVTNTAFWAVDHRASGIKSIPDLRVFERIVTYHPGTTGHRIARYIRMATGLDTPIDCVDMGTEILRLTSSPEGTIALSPNLLEIDELLATRAEFNVAFDLASAPEFSNVLVTALLSRQDIVTNHGLLFRGLLGALAYAMMMVRLEDEEVVSYAAARFERPKERIRAVLERTSRGQVFPASLEITSAQWENAVRAYCETTGKEFTDSVRANSSNLFMSHIGLHLDLIRRAGTGAAIEKIKKEQIERTSKQIAKREKYHWSILLLVSCFAFAAGLVAPDWPKASVLLGAVGGVAAGVALLYLSPLREARFARLIHCFLLGAAVISAALARLDLIEFKVMFSILGLLASYWIKLAFSMPQKP